MSPVVPGTISCSWFPGSITLPGVSPNKQFLGSVCRCFSSVGNQNVGKQRLSIGKNCDRLGTVEHEFLHALGFWHEQSRDDRDDYVTIIWDQIEPGTVD